MSVEKLSERRGFNHTSPQADPDNPNADRIATLEEKVHWLESMLKLPSRFANPFIANMSASKMWAEMSMASGSLGTYTSGRLCNDSASSCALVTLADGQALALQVADPPDVRFVPIPNPAFGVYLTQSGGSNGSTTSFPTYTYNIFLDAAKTLQIGSAVTVEGHRLLKVPVTAATHGLFQWNGTSSRLLMVDEYPDQTACT